MVSLAGRVKELIGTIDSGTDRGVSQLTRTTGYSDLLAACGVDSGDVTSNTAANKAGQTSSTKPTNSDQPTAVAQLAFLLRDAMLPRYQP